jgi:hypothetical protein
MHLFFPGMDPYLEEPHLWPTFHTPFLVAIAAQLQPLLEPKYVASVEERVYLTAPQKEVIPDVQIRRTRHSSPLPAAAPVLEADAPTVLRLRRQRRHEVYVAIREVKASQRIVTVIEVLSPSNKRRQGPAQLSYKSAQRETVAQGIHLVEIDLLRHGTHQLRVPRRHARQLAPYDYLICVPRASQRSDVELYARHLRERLPRILLPLVTPDMDVVLDLQAVLERVYYEGRFYLRIDYDQPCQPRLSAEDQAWATQQWQAYRTAHPELFPPEGTP